MAESIIPTQKGLFLAADVKHRQYNPLLESLEGVEGLDGVKLGFEIGLTGLREAVNDALEINDKWRMVYDHQKAGNDIPETGLNFARAMRIARVDAAILFPFTGPQTQERWIRELQERGVAVIQGAEMTHAQIRASEGGYILDGAFHRMFEKAVELGVRDFVVPGNKPEAVTTYKEQFDSAIGEGNYTLWAPGFVNQGGDVSETGALAGPRFNAIVGSAIYKAEDPRQAAIDLGQKMLQLNAQSSE